MADNKINLVITTNAPEALNKTAEAANNTAKGVLSAKQELRQLQKAMGDMDVNSKEFATAAERAGKLKDQLNDAADAVRGNTGPAIEGMNNTFGIMRGQIENLDFGGLGQSFKTLGQNVSRINFGTVKEELGGLVKGLGQLGKALLANPIFLLAGAIAAIVVYWDEISGAISGTTRKVEELTAANEKLARTNINLESRLKHEQALYGNTLKVYELQKEIANNNIKVAKNELEIAKTTKDITKEREAENKLIEARNSLTAISDQQEKNRLTAVEKARALTTKNYKEYVDNESLKNELVVAREQTLEQIAAKEKEISDLKDLQSVNDKYGFNLGEKKLVNTGALYGKQNELNQLKQQEKDITEGISKAEELRGQIGKKSAEELKRDAEQRQKDELAKKELYQKQREEEIKRQDDLYAALQKIQENAQEQEITTAIERSEALYELAGNDVAAQLLIKENLEKQISEIQKKYADEREKAKQEKLDKEWEADMAFAEKQKELKKSQFEAEKQLKDAEWNLANASVDLLGALFQKNKKAADIAFVLQKALAIGKVVVDTQAEIAGYYAANALAGPAGMAIATSQALAAKIRAATSIATIAASSVGKFMSGGASVSVGGGGRTVSGGGGNMQQPSAISLGFLNNRPSQQPPIQAYVIGSQVNTSVEAQTLIHNQAKLH